MKFTRKVPMNCHCPLGWGPAWFDPCRDERVAMPIPINLIVRIAIAIYWGTIRLTEVPWKYDVGRRRAELRREYLRGAHDAFAGWIDPKTYKEDLLTARTR